MKRQLNPERRGEQNVDLPRFDFLQIARGDFGALGQFFLGQTFPHPLPAQIGAKDLDSLPFFFGNSHDILHRHLMPEMNDTYIVKQYRIALANAGVKRCTHSCIGSHTFVTCLDGQKNYRLIKTSMKPT